MYMCFYFIFFFALLVSLWCFYTFDRQREFVDQPFYFWECCCSMGLFNCNFVFVCLVKYLTTAKKMKNHEILFFAQFSFQILLWTHTSNRTNNSSSNWKSSANKKKPAQRKCIVFFKCLTLCLFIFHIEFYATARKNKTERKKSILARTYIQNEIIIILATHTKFSKHMRNKKNKLAFTVC